MKIEKDIVLYSPAEIHRCIKQLFSKPDKRDRRVALVAYVGDYRVFYEIADEIRVVRVNRVRHRREAYR